MLKIKNIVSTLFLAESHYDIGQLEQELVELFKREPNKPAVSLFLNWLKQLAKNGQMDENDYSALEKVYSSTQEVNMLLTSIRQERKQLFQDGMTQGITQGKIEGQWEEKGNLARRKLHENVDISLITKVTQLYEQEIWQLKINH